MVRIRLLLVRMRRIACMARVDAGEYGVIRRINVAIGAG